MAGTRLPPVVIATVQTLTAGGDGSGRMSKFDPAMFGVVIVDEAHHGTSSTYRRTLEYFRQNPALRVLGVTATPDRADEEALGQVFDTVAYDYEILDAIGLCCRTSNWRLRRKHDDFRGPRCC